MHGDRVFDTKNLVREGNCGRPQGVWTPRPRPARRPPRTRASCADSASRRVCTPPLSRKSWPPSENESGVRFSTPTTLTRSGGKRVSFATQPSSLGFSQGRALGRGDHLHWHHSGSVALALWGLGEGPGPTSSPDGLRFRQRASLDQDDEGRSSQASPVQGGLLRLRPAVSRFTCHDLYGFSRISGSGWPRLPRRWPAPCSRCTPCVSRGRGPRRHPHPASAYETGPSVFTHAVFRDHLPRPIRGLLKVIGRAGREVSEDQLLQRLDRPSRSG